MYRKLKLNTITSLLFQVTTVVTGFILPRLILGHFGSSVNGLVNSITQFIHIIAFLELGVGSVVQSSLYKPLSDCDNHQTSLVVASANRFFRTLAKILLVYVVLLIGVYPMLINKSFDWMYTATLIAAMSISSFAQYYFGIVNRLLLTADQKGYIQYSLQILTLVLNTVSCVVLIRLDASIQFVKLATSLIYLIRPLLLAYYVKRHYALDTKVKYTADPIKQKWNGVAQHVAYVIMNSSASIILTLMSTLENVSIYSVYHLVIYGVKELFMSMSNGIQALLGQLWAKQDMKKLDEVFAWTEWVIHTCVILVFGCTSTLIVPFVVVYTAGISDANYIQPLFSIILVVAHGAHCLRLPYNMIIFAGGHYKQTQNNYVFATVLNIFVSLVAVKLWGLVGVALGTLLAMLYQTVWMAWYNSKHLMKRPMKIFLKQLKVDTITVVLLAIISRFLDFTCNSYFAWFVQAVQCFAVYLLITVCVNWIFYREHVRKLIHKFNLRIRKADI